MAAQGSLATLGVVELLQIAALFRKMGSLRLVFGNGRTVIIYFQDAYLSGLTDSGRVWQLGDLLEQLGRVGVDEKRRLLATSKVRGKRLGQLLLEEGYVSREEMESVLRRLILQSLLFAVENESAGGFELLLGAVSQTTVMFPITDFLIELTSAVDELQRLRGLLGPKGNVLAIDPHRDFTSTYRALSYRLVQVLAHVDGEKTAMDVAAAAPFSPTETLSILCELARSDVIRWARSEHEGDMATLLPFRPAAKPAAEAGPHDAASVDGAPYGAAAPDAP
ncbi:MAG: DUF4388 domain-containing protein [Actinobacteria bacterium]|nr:DUF4388 domain-containing protein [Actinomycetota bacterium]